METPLRTVLLIGGSILLAAAPAVAQRQQVAAVARNNAVALDRRANNTPSIAEQRARMSDLRKRKAALARYLATIPPGSPDYRATAGAISKLDSELKALVNLLGEEPRAFGPTAAPVASTRSLAVSDTLSARTAARGSHDVAAPQSKITV
ncbi:MAG TPA: hypothetical protein VD861_14190, partial [Pyrinomonadaceae bacterium]|nr:hypothetical protein [Pyrinomonadaceae bacterium]